MIMIHYHQTNIPIVIETTQYPPFSGWKMIGIGHPSFHLTTPIVLTIAHDLKLITD